MNPLWILLIGMAVVVGGVLVLRLHAFLALILGALVVAALTPGASITSVGGRVAEGFAETAKNIAILIAMASIIGETLLASGAAERIVVSARRALGDNRAGLAFLISGYVLGIPVFFDTVFYLLIPLGKVMRARTGRDYLLYVLCIVAGATMTHSLVPPTPGPLVVASMLGVELWIMILAGIVVSAFAAVAGYTYAKWANRRWTIPLRVPAGTVDEAADHAAARDDSHGESVLNYESRARSAESALPPLWLSLTPILLPVVMIALAAVFDPKTFKPGPTTPAWLTKVVIPAILTLGEKNISLTLAAGIGLVMVVRRKRQAGEGTKAIAAAVNEALASAGVIILITAAGGSFGFVLRQTGIAESIKALVPAGRLALLPLAFLLTTLVRTAQGSATVAMITAAGIVGPIAVTGGQGGQGGLGFHPVYLALAIGCGSKPVMWMNDSGFWIIGKMSGLTEAETLKSATIMMAIMGVVGLLVVMVGAWLLPLS
jgi:GntP family gluconate:H+ symporter